MGCVNKDGKVIVPPEFDSIWIPVNSRLNVMVNRQWGALDDSGECIITPQFDELSEFDNHGIAAARLGSSWSLVNDTGSQIVEETFDRLYCAGMDMYVGTKDGESIIFSVRTNIEKRVNSAYVFCNGDPRRIVLFDHERNCYRFISFFSDIATERWCFDNAQLFQCNYALVKRDGVSLYIDYNGNVAVTTERAREIRPFSGWLAAYYNGELWGFLSSPSSIAIEAAYDDIGYFQNGVCPASMHGKWGYITMTGEWTMRPQFDDLSPLYLGGFGYGMIDNRRVVVDVVGKVLFEE